MIIVTAMFRALAAWSTAEWVLHDPLTRRNWWLVPVQDLVSLLVWVWGFFGRTIDWRGRRYRFLSGGRLQFVGSAPATTEITHGLPASTGAFHEPDSSPNNT